MPNLIELTGKRFNRLVVLKRAPNRRINKRIRVVYWLCRCDCGTEKEIIAGSLLQGRIKSCGCIIKEIRRKRWEAKIAKEGRTFAKIPVDMREYRADDHFRRQYGLTIEDVRVRVMRQGRRCAICSKEVRLYVDHDHENGKLRGMLCFKCNNMLGNAEDNIHILFKAMAYLEKWRSEHEVSENTLPSQTHPETSALPLQGASKLV